MICSKDRMFRPSRPMILPFMSSPESCTVETTDSVVWSEANRWITVARTRLARASASSCAALSMSRAVIAAALFASASMLSTSWS